MRLYFLKQNPKIICYRDYKKFCNEIFKAELDNELSKHDIYNIGYQHFLNIFLEILNKHVPVKKRFIRANQRSFITPISVKLQ